MTPIILQLPGVVLRRDEHGMAIPFELQFENQWREEVATHRYDRADARSLCEIAILSDTEEQTGSDQYLPAVLAETFIVHDRAHQVCELRALPALGNNDSVSVVAVFVDKLFARLQTLDIGEAKLADNLPGASRSIHCI